MPRKKKSPLQRNPYVPKREKVQDSDRVTKRKEGLVKKKGNYKGKLKVGGMDPLDPSQNKTENEKISKNISTTISLTIVPDNNAMLAAVQPICTYLLENGFIGNFLASPVGTTSTPAAIMQSGLGYLLDTLQNLAQGATPTLTMLPRFLNVLAEGLAPKTAKFKTGSVTFAWSSALNWTGLPNSYTNGFGTFVYYNVNKGYGYDIALVPQSVGSNVDSWNLLMEYLPKEGTLTELVKIQSKEISTGDVSAFARQYVFNGIGSTTTGGFYTDIENEIPIRIPLFSKIVMYGTLDYRVPRFLSPSGGDSLMMTGLPLMESFKYEQYKNKYTPIYKCIDIYEIITLLQIWAGAVFDKYTQTIDGEAAAPETNPLNTPFTFTLQDFSIMIRQALMSIFSSQKMVQYLQPREFSFASDNGFVPLVASFGTYGHPAFRDVNLPQFIVENLNSLKMHEFQPEVSHKVSRNIYRVIPVLGYYVKDTLAAVTWTDINQAQQFVFAQTIQNSISLVDGASAGSFIDLNNAYYHDVMAQWNDFVLGASQYVTPCQSIGSDTGVRGLPLCVFTRFYSLITADFDSPYKQKMHIRTMRKCLNYKDVVVDMKSRKVLERMPSQKELKDELQVRSIPAATTATLTISSLTMQSPVPDEILGYLNYLILPSMRVDPTSTLDPTTLSMFQTETCESSIVNYSPVDNSGNTSGTSVFTRLSEEAQLNVTGTAGANNPTYISIMSLLSKMGKNAGLIGSLLGGFANSFLGGTPLQGVGNLMEQIPF